MLISVRKSTKVEKESFSTFDNIAYLQLFDTVSLVELLDTSASLSCLLLSGVERMAFGADFNVDILLGRTGNKRVAAVASYSCLIIFRMDSFAH